jgi:hypothetical protein
MDPVKLRALISAMLTTVLSGNTDTRMQYLGILCDHLHHYIEREKVSRDRAPILNTQRNLISSFNYIAINASGRYKLNEKQKAGVLDTFKEWCILDASWGQPRALYGAMVVKELTGVRAAKMHYLRAVAEYSRYLAGSPDGLTGCTVEISAALQIIQEICYDNDLCDLDGGEWRKQQLAFQKPAPAPAAQQPDPNRTR